MPIMIFQIPQVVNLVLPESSGATGAIMSNYPMNRSDFTLVRNVQNEIEFFVRDIDRQAAVITTGSTLTLNIIDPQDNTVLLSRVLTVQDATRSLYRATLLYSETANWNIGPLSYNVSLLRPDTTTVMLWTDRDYTPGGYLKVVEGPLPAPVPALSLDPTTFLNDSGLLGVPLDATLIVSSALLGSAQLNYPNGMHTIAATLAGFTGTITIQASIAATPLTDSDWFIATQQSFSLITGVQSLNTQGNFLWVRIIISAVAAGSVTQILYKN